MIPLPDLQNPIKPLQHDLRRAVTVFIQHLSDDQLRLRCHSLISPVRQAAAPAKDTTDMRSVSIVVIHQIPSTHKIPEIEHLSCQIRMPRHPGIKHGYCHTLLPILFPPRHNPELFPHSLHITKRPGIIFNSILCPDVFYCSKEYAVHFP